jgi:hypothetical protein
MNCLTDKQKELLKLKLSAVHDAEMYLIEQGIMEIKIDKRDIN